MKVSSQKNTTRRVVVVTGAAAGVGRALAREFGKEKASVALIARDRKSLWATKRESELCTSSLA